MVEKLQNPRLNKRENAEKGRIGTNDFSGKAPLRRGKLWVRPKGSRGFFVCGKERVPDGSTEKTVEKQRVPKSSSIAKAKKASLTFPQFMPELWKTWRIPQKAQPAF